jgi:hypothetical protein
LWFIDQLEGSVQYHIPVVFRMQGDVNIEGLEYAFRNIVNRHEVLRTVIEQKGGRAFQRVLEKDRWRLGIADQQMLEKGSRQACVEELISRPFDLSRDHMLRADVVQVGERDRLLVVTVHHIASDGWSAAILLEEFTELYSSYVQGRPGRLQDLLVQYADYALWQRRYLQGALLEQGLLYWQQKLQGAQVLQMPTDYGRPVVQSNRGAVSSFSIDERTTSALQRLSEENGATLYMTLLSVLKVLLYRYSQQTDISVGSAVAGRTQQETEGLIGFFVNTLVLRSDVSGNPRFVDLLDRVRTTTLEAYAHQEVPFERVVETVVKERDMSRSPLFQVMLVLQNTQRAVMDSQVLKELAVSVEPTVHRTSKFDLSFSISQTSDGRLDVYIEYCTDLYSSSTIDRLGAHYRALSEAVSTDSSQRINELAMLSSSERDQLLHQFNATTVDYPRDKTVVDLFGEQVKRSPDAVAVVCEDRQLTYGQLDEQSGKLA